MGAIRQGAPLVASLTAMALSAFDRNRPAGAGLLALAAWSAWFFRDPPRNCPGDPQTLYSAADGTVMSVEDIEWDWFIHGRALRIATFLSLLDVHVNRSPAAGRLVAYRRDPGTFAPAFLTHGSEHNARQLLGFEIHGDHGHQDHQDHPARPSSQVVVAQMAGFLARRIVTWRLPGDTVAAGDKIGMIRFGSRTDVIIPAGLAEPLVSPGTKVRSGVTPLARYL